MHVVCIICIILGTNHGCRLAFSFVDNNAWCILNRGFEMIIYNKAKVFALASTKLTSVVICTLVGKSLYLFH